MSLDSVRAFMAANAPDIEPIALERDSETHSLSSAWGIKAAQIAKTLALRCGDRSILLVSCGDARLDNKKLKDAFGGKTRMLSASDAAAITGHPVGGVCPFGLITALPIFCDLQLKRFEIVVTAAGATDYALRVGPLRMAEITHAQWVDVCAA